jgi:hypothetical protein
MAYGTIKVDNIIFTNGGSDQTVTVSGIVASTSGNLTVTGTISGGTVKGTYGSFTSLTGVTTSGTNANFQTITGAVSVYTTSISGLAITGNTAGFTTVTGTTVTGTTANFVTLSGTTITGGTINVTTTNITSGIFAAGSAAAPSIAFTGDTDTGIYSPGANQVAISTNGTERLFVDATGVVVAGTLSRNGFNVVTVGDVGTVTSTMIASGTIIDADVNISGAINATKLNFLQAGTSAVARTVDSRLKDIVSAVDFGAIGDGSLSTNDMFTAVTAAWNAALAAGKDLFFPAGTYTIGNANFPWRQGGSPTTLLDCKNITIRGEGPATVFKTISPVGADVFQLNGVKNLHFRNLAITAELTGFSDAGSNGISITAGFDNITINDVYIYDLPSLDKTTYADGGKALTLQLANNDTLCGSLSARIRVKNCLHGFGFEPVLHRLQDQPCSIKIQLQAEKCWQGIVYNAAAATSTLNSGFNSGLQIDAILTNCQKDVVLSRAHGCDIRATIVTTESKVARTKNSAGVTWLASDVVVTSLVTGGAHNSQVKIIGYKGSTDYKAQIGGSTQGSSGLVGATLNSDIFLDISGTSATADILPVDVGGNTLRQSKLAITSATSATIPSDFADAIKKNVFEVIGEYGQAILPGNVRFPATQVSSADPNTLDDYEEGAWTPAFSISGGGSATFTITRGRYVKVGSYVYAWFSAIRNDASALSGSVTWTLPFPTAEVIAWAPVGTYWASNCSQGIVVVDNFVNNIANGCESTTIGVNTYLSYVTLANGSNLSVSMTFITDT